MTTTTQGVGRVNTDSSAQSRFAALAEQVRAIRGRRTTRSDAWMLYVGGTLMPLGGLLIILGWAGASRTPLQFEQTPYLISGGLLGLGLVVAGGFVYFGYWQSLRIRESRRQSEDLTAAVARLETLIAAGRSEDGVEPARRFVATPQGSIFHRPDCTVVAGRDQLRRIDPERDDLAPCQICEPLASTA